MTTGLRDPHHDIDAARGGRVVPDVAVEPIVGKPALFPPGHVTIQLGPQHRRAYLRLWGLSFPLSGVPALKDRDFDGRRIKLTQPQLAALNRAFASLRARSRPETGSAFEAQEQSSRSTSREMQFLS